jgi:hypothetical protein
MKHTNHPNWKNLTSAEKNIVRLGNYKKRDLKNSITTLENCISEEKKKGEATSHLEGILRREQFALDNNPFYRGKPADNFMEDIRNLFKDYDSNMRRINE